MPSDTRSGRPRSGHAVVIGGSIGGCMAAQVLSERFERVTLCEAGDFRADAVARTNVPQEHHVHLLLLRGKEVMESIFPGLLDQLIHEGAIEADLGHDVKWFQYGRWKNRYKTGVRAHYCSRALIDSAIRRRISQNSRISVRKGTAVTGLSVRRDVGPSGAVSGVEIAGNGKTATEEVKADLVVDSSGRRSKMPKWLRQHGYGEVAESLIETRLGYASRIYRRHREYDDRWKVLLVLPEPPRGRSMGVISPIEGDRWLVTTGGWFGCYPKPSVVEFESFLESLPVPDVAGAVQDAEPLSDVFGFGMLGSRMRHYDKLPGAPDGLVVLGDAVCSLNPLYSQGMTVCALEVDELRRLAPRWVRGESHAADIQSAIVDIVRPAWAMAVDEDLRFPEAEGPRSLRLRARHSYTRHLVRASAFSRTVLQTQVGVTNLVTDPSELYRPMVAGRVLLDYLSPRSEESFA